MVWVGSQNDLPLVHSGLQQAEALANALLVAQAKPDAIYCSHLKRAIDYAQIVADRLSIHSPIVIDNRLNELDYGQWSGLEDAEIIKRFGEEDFNNWRNAGIWPKSGAWGGTEDVIIEQVKSFLQDMLKKYAQAETVLAVTSNGRLRYFFKELLEQNKYAAQRNELNHKVGTGRVCILENKNHSSSGGDEYGFKRLDILCWNEKPETALAFG